MPIVERAEAMKAVILQHCWFKVNGNLPGESTPHDLVELALRHPKAVFIDAHTGGDWELGIRAIRPARNIATCVAGFDPTSGCRRDGRAGTRRRTRGIRKRCGRPKFRIPACQGDWAPKSRM